MDFNWIFPSSFPSFKSTRYCYLIPEAITEARWAKHGATGFVSINLIKILDPVYKIEDLVNEFADPVLRDVIYCLFAF